MLAACATLPDENFPTRAPLPPVAQTPTPIPAAEPAAPAAAPSADTTTQNDSTAAATNNEPTPAAQLAGLTLDQYPDLLDRVRAGFQLEDIDNRAIDLQLSWYARNPEYLERVFGRAELYLHHIVKEAERRGMPLEIALLPVIESAFEPWAYSPSRAAGLWQFIADTGQRYGLKQNWWYEGRRDVVESTRAALDYLQFMHDEFNGDWLLAVAGYNCGENCVARRVRENRAAGRPIDFFSLHLPAETRAYVPKLMAMRRLIANPQDYGIEFSHIPNEPYFSRVSISGPIDLKLAADLAGLTHEAVFELNPAFHRWASPPNGPFELLLPTDAADLFRENVTKLTPDEMMRVTRHTVARGDTVASISQRYSTQPLIVRQLNDLGNGKLVVGSELRVPSGMTTLPDKVLRAAARFDGGNRRLLARRGLRRPHLHVVRRGDSLWAIARRNGMDVRTLARLNNLRPGQKLQAGRRLIVGRSAAPNGSAPNGKTQRVALASGSSRTIHYKVRRGDTLFRIARIHNVTVDQILSWNGMGAGSGIRPGQRLSITLARSR